MLIEVDIPESEQGKDYVLREEQAREVIDYALRIEDERGTGQFVECGYVGKDYWLTQVTLIPVTASPVSELSQVVLPTEATRTGN